MKIKVLHITKMKGVSGSENHLLTLLSELDKERFEIHFCILAEAAHTEFLQDYKGQLERAGVTTFILPMRKYLALPLVTQLRAYIRRYRFQIVHTHLIHADLYGTFAAKLADVPAIISSRHNDDRFRRHVMLVGLNRLLARWHAKVIVISDWVGTFLKQVEKIPVRKIVRIHYGLEIDEIARYADPQYVRRHFQIPENYPVIGTLARLSEQKGHRYLLQAVKILSSRFPDIRAVLIGDGELHGELTSLAKELNIEQHIIFAGFRERDEACRLLSGIDLFVFPSVWEGFGLVLLETMALKKAIVASDVSAIPESVLDGKTGLLVPPKESGQLAEAIQTLLEDRSKAEAMGQAGYRHLQEQFSVRKMIQATERVYKDVLLDVEEKGKRW